MKKAIAVLGPPISGKTTILRPYTHRVVHLGEYAHTLPDHDRLKQQCIAHWNDNTPFSPSLLEKLLQSYPLNEHSWVLLDGTPRDSSQLPILQECFTLSAVIEVTVEESLWEERATHAAQQERRTRYDSSLPQLIKRKEAHRTAMEEIRPHFQHNYTLDNSTDILTTREAFSAILKDIIQRNRGVKAS